MKVWSQEEFLNHEIWYHATSGIFFERILTDGVVASVNKDTELDFGYGFYLTPSYRWAKKFAEGFNNPRIIEFHFKPIEILAGSKNFNFFGRLNMKFADFVFHNRMDYEQYPDKCVHNFALVGGVMSDGNQIMDFEEYRSGLIGKDELYQRICTPKEDWQLLIHAQSLCDRIAPFAAYDLEGETYDVSKYKKTHQPSGIAVSGCQQGNEKADGKHLER